jgi:uncharacterized protein YukE
MTALRLDFPKMRQVAESLIQDARTFNGQLDQCKARADELQRIWAGSLSLAGTAYQAHWAKVEEDGRIVFQSVSALGEALRQAAQEQTDNEMRMLEIMNGQR